MVRIREAIVVEGRYDKNTLLQIVDAPVFETSGFGIFKDPQQLKLLRTVAQSRGLIIFTDSDGAGFVIRNYLQGAIDPKLIKHAYIPDILGKEKRKKTPGKEGKLGVEGMTPQIILEALRRAGATINDSSAAGQHGITKQDMVELGFSGGKNSAEKRQTLLKKLDLPERMSTNALLQVLNLVYSLEEFKEIALSLQI